MRGWSGAKALRMDRIQQRLAEDPLIYLSRSFHSD